MTVAVLQLVALVYLCVVVHLAHISAQKRHKELTFHHETKRLSDLFADERVRLVASLKQELPPKTKYTDGEDYDGTSRF